MQSPRVFRWLVSLYSMSQLVKPISKTVEMWRLWLNKSLANNRNANSTYRFHFYSTSPYHLIVRLSPNRLVNESSTRTNSRVRVAKSTTYDGANPFCWSIPILTWSINLQCNTTQFDLNAFNPNNSHQFAKSLQYNFTLFISRMKATWFNVYGIHSFIHMYTHMRVSEEYFFSYATTATIQISIHSTPLHSTRCINSFIYISPIWMM